MQPPAIQSQSLPWLCVLAVADGIEVGVDLEQVRGDLEHLKLAERFFSPGEADAVRKKTGHERWTTFFRYWTGKEAYLRRKEPGYGFPCMSAP